MKMEPEFTWTGPTLTREEKLRRRLGDEWYEAIGEEFDKPYMAELQEKVNIDRTRKIVYPPPKDVFRAFRLTQPSKVKVVMLGQDPYNDGCATGLAFECGTPFTPSFKKIYEVYENDFPSHFNIHLMEGKLEHWAEDGVFLLNVSLTVPKKDPGRYLKYWEPFTRKAIEHLIFHQNPKVFVLMGSFARKFREWITLPHFALEYEHPAFAARESRPWDASGMFKTIDKFLTDNKITPIDW
jgi:uracil-DNA glycosylase